MAINLPIVSKFDDKGIKQADQALTKFSKAAGAIAAAATAAVAGIAVVSVKEFAKFDAALTKSTAIMGDVSDALKKDMADAAREVAKTTTFSAEQAAESYFFLASAGLDAAASIEAMPQVAKFAQAGMFDMALATDLLTDAQSALGLTVRDDAIKNLENMAQISDVLVKANTLANASVEQFSTALTTKAGPAMRALGMDVEEGVAVLAAFADQGIKGELAGTNFAIVLRDLQTKAINNKEAFEQAGVAVFDATGDFNNMGDIVADLEGLLGGMSDETKKATLSQLGFSDKSMAAISALLGMSDAIKGYESDLRDAGGTTQEVADKQLESLAAQFELLKSKVTDIGITIGEALVPVVLSLVDTFEKKLLPRLVEFSEWLKSPDGEEAVKKLGDAVVGVVDFLIDFSTWITENLGLVKTLGITFGVIAASVKIYTTAVQLAAIANAIFSATLWTNPVFLMIAAVAGLTAMFVLNNGAVEDNIGTYKKLKAAEGDLAYTAKGTADKFKDSAYVHDKYGVALDATTKAAYNTATKVQYLGTEVARADKAKFANLPGQLNNVTRAADGTTNALNDTKDATVNLTIVEQARERYKQEQINTLGRSTRTLQDFIDGMTRNAAATAEVNNLTAETTTTYDGLSSAINTATNSVANLSTKTDVLEPKLRTISSIGGVLKDSFEDMTIPEVTIDSFRRMAQEVEGLYGVFDEGGNLVDVYSGYQVAQNVPTASGDTVDVGRIIDTANSLTVAGADFEAAIGGSLQQVFDTLTQGKSFVSSATGLELSADQLTGVLEDLATGVEAKGLTPFASGGLVTGPTAALVGEAGPEVVIPLDRFESMMGASANPGKGGSTYNVTVNAGMGADGGRIGQLIVDEIIRYERSSGRVFARA